MAKLVGKDLVIGYRQQVIMALCQILLIANFTVLEVRQLLMLFFYLVWCAFVVV